MKIDADGVSLKGVVSLENFAENVKEYINLETKHFKWIYYLNGWDFKSERNY